MRVSFDFDSTLSEPDVQKYAKELVKRGVDVWLTTARYSDEEAEKLFIGHSDIPWNNDLYEICAQVGIPKEKMKFMNMLPKAFYFKKESFIWHLDDDPIELMDIVEHSPHVRGILHEYPKPWREECESLLKIAKSLI